LGSVFDASLQALDLGLGCCESCVSDDDGGYSGGISADVWQIGGEFADIIGGCGVNGRQVFIS